MTDFALDCSVAAAWFFKDEAGPATDALRARAVEKGAVVPALWHLEIGNVFRMAEKRNRITARDTAIHLEFIDTLLLETEGTILSHRLQEILALARSHNLTTYDTAYLELAIRRGIPLATTDSALRQAAQRLGIAVLPD